MKKAAVSSILVAVVLLALGVIAEAQQPKKVPLIGYLSTQDPALESIRSERVRLALRERGYIEGQNIAIEYRYAEGRPDREPGLAAELVRLKVNCEFDLRRLLHRQISRLGSLQDPVHVICDAPVAVRLVRRIRHDPAGIYETSVDVHRWQPAL